MPPLKIDPTARRFARPLLTLCVVSLLGWTAAGKADTVTDWDAKATAVASPGALGEREAAIMNVAMIDAVNSIEQWRPAHLQPCIPTQRPDSRASSRTTFPTCTPMRRACRTARDSARTSRRKCFRPALTSREWAVDYNEIKALGSKLSAQRAPQQTESARFWLMAGAPVYHPLAWQVVAARKFSLIDSARFMAMYSVVLTDAYVAVMDAKYHYEFWRPMTAIRNGDIDGNPNTELDATWQPVDATPMHPEYPCAHCIIRGAVRSVIESLAGTQDLPEFC